jgi:hypothetical protein
VEVEVNVYAIDPGPVKSAGVIVTGDIILSPEILANEQMVQSIYERRAHYPIAIEMIASYGMPVGREVFETCLWIGRFIQAAHPHPVALVYRKDVKLHLCGSVRAKDPNIRQALLDRFGKEATKGVKKDMWAALGVAVTHLDAHPVALGDCPGGPLDRDGVEVEEGNKGHAFDEMWGVRK